MSRKDREKWDRRYREGAYAERTHPSAILSAWIDRLPTGRALDLACGAGRNALFLASRGYAVDAVDVSGEALRRAEASAMERGVSVNWLEWDLDEPLELPGSYQLILLIRYIDMALIRKLGAMLAPGGTLVCEAHLQTSEDVVGPRSAAFRVGPGELSAAAGDLAIIHQEEGLVTEPDGKRAALSRLIARKSP
jgi:2-polyprenyl-3-methyl-5-hydroxy-6-metoxy-1,4-benzoquinol methylase